MLKLLKKLKQKSFFYPILFVGLLFFVFNFQGSIETANTAPSDNIEGWAWSDAIGWISFNCTDFNCASTDYGVRLDPSTMNFYGYAWSDNVGWINFGSSTTATPDSNAFSSNCQDSGADCVVSTECIACYNPDNNKVYGWAHIISMGDDGWISLNCENDGSCVTSNYGVYVNQADFYGWGWNGNVIASSGIGWINFRGSSTTIPWVTLTNIHFPDAHNLTAPNWAATDACNAGAKGAILTWDFYDKDGDSQGYYQVIVNTVNSTSSPLINSTKLSGTAEQYIISSNDLKHDTAYYWWVKVWDQYGFPSGLVQFDTDVDTATTTHLLTDNQAANVLSTTFTTYAHEFPVTDFDFVPDEIIKGEIATFTSNSLYYTDASPTSSNACNDSNCDYLWSAVGIEPGGIASPTEEMTEMLFKYSLNPSVATTTIFLRVTDINGYICTTTTSTFVDLLPNWKEIKVE